MNRDLLVNGEKLSVQKFLEPSREFGIMPFWFWNGELTDEEMEYQLREYYDKGIPAIYIHSRFGLLDHMPYLGDKWFDRVRFCIEKAQEIGLQVWVYDEYNWPSGTVGQTIQKENPDLTNVYLQLVEFDLPGQFFTFLEGTDSRYFNLEQSEPIYACAIKLDDLENGRLTYIDLMPSLSFDKVITWEAPKGPWKLFYFIQRQASWYTDVLNPETTKIFLEKTHERYKAAQGGKFSRESGAQGFYTDEPAMFYFEAGRDNLTLPWSKNMFRIFREHNGYDLKKHLPQLFFDIGPETQKIRHDFWSTLSDQYDTAYYKQIGDWCEENDVIFTGHLLHEESIRMHAKSGGNLFHHLSHMQLIGVDHLYPRIGTRQMPNEHVALKIASSAAHHYGSTRLLCESMGGAYWDCTMERMKWIADWEYVLGVNILNPHGFHYSIEGERKRDWPPSQFYHHTWWEQYGAFNEYLTRIAYLMTGGHHVAKAAILYPIHSIWANYRPQIRDRISDGIENDFVYLTDRLLRLHVDFDYIDEDVLAEAEIKDGALWIRDERYELLILPPVTHIKQTTLEKMEAFIHAGGRILGNALLPGQIVDGDSMDVPQRITALFGQQPAAARETFLNEAVITPPQIQKKVHPNQGLALFIEGCGLWRQDSLSVLKEAVLCCITPDVEINSEEIFYLHRVKDDQNFYFFINPTGDTLDVNVSVEGVFAPELWNLENGTTSPIWVYQIQENRTCFSLSFAPYGSYMVSYSGAPSPIHATHSDMEIDRFLPASIEGHARLTQQGSITVNQQGKIKSYPLAPQPLIPPMDLSGRWATRTDKPNALLIQSWKFLLDDDTVNPENFAGPTEQWLDFRMGAWEMQLPVEREQAIYPVDLWFCAEYQAAYLPHDLTLMIDGFKGESYSLYINGQPVTQTPVRSYLDAEIQEVPITSYTLLGKNQILLRITARKKMDGLLDPIKLSGTFSVTSDASGEAIAAPIAELSTGDWIAQGYPYYSGSVYYTKTIQVSSALEEKILFLSADVGADVLEVWVNGEKVGTRLWKPYRLNLTGVLHTGENTLTLRVINTVSNILEATKIPSGLFDATITPYNPYVIHLADA